jgi:hypothetical protein
MRPPQYPRHPTERAADRPAVANFPSSTPADDAAIGEFSAGARTPRLLAIGRQETHVRHDSLGTEDAYGDRVRRFVRFHGRSHPRGLMAGRGGRVHTEPDRCDFVARSVSIAVPSRRTGPSAVRVGSQVRTALRLLAADAGRFDGDGAAQPPGAAWGAPGG